MCCLSYIYHILFILCLSWAQGELKSLNSLMKHLYIFAHFLAYITEICLCKNPKHRVVFRVTLRFKMFMYDLIYNFSTPFFFFFRATPPAFGSSWAMGRIGAIAAGLYHSQATPDPRIQGMSATYTTAHSNAGSKPRL